MCLAGEPGIGKTALIGEALERAEACGFLVLSGRAAEFESDLPFAVLADALESEVDPGVIEELDGHGLVRSFRALLAGIAEARPLVLALDDLHWADPASLDVVCHLLHRGPDGPVLLLLASRPAQTEPRLLTALEEAERHSIGRRIDLAPLSAEAAGELLGDELAPAAREALYRDSGGNPFYLQQLAGAARRTARAPAPVGDGDEAGLPAGVAASIVLYEAARQRTVIHHGGTESTEEDQ